MEPPGDEFQWKNGNVEAKFNAFDYKGVRERLRKCRRGDCATI
jgi:hypothetical protein